MTYIPATDRLPATDGQYRCRIHSAECICWFRNGRWEGVYDQSIVWWIEDATELDTTGFE
jgi:hypothetical protein